MFGIGSTELLVILVVALIVLGPKSLATISRSLGKAMGEFRRVSTDFQRTLNAEAAQEEEAERRKKDAEKAARAAAETKAAQPDQAASPATAATAAPAQEQSVTEAAAPATASPSEAKTEVLASPAPSPSSPAGDAPAIDASSAPLPPKDSPLAAALAKTRAEAEAVAPAARHERTGTPAAFPGSAGGGCCARNGG